MLERMAIMEPGDAGATTLLRGFVAPAVSLVDTLAMKYDDDDNDPLIF